MAEATSDKERIAVLEARVGALDSLLKSVLTTFVLRGMLSRADIQPLINTAEEMLGDHPDRSRIADELDRIGQDLPGYQRQRMGPQQSDADHDH
ncbi:MAG: hypothetical protein RLZ98_2034 [Pseudomonadota bacterium]|jgi:hypothetical protein